MPNLAATVENLNSLFATMEKYEERQVEAAEALNALKIKHAEDLSRLQLDLLQKKAKKEMDLNQEVVRKYLEDEEGNFEAVLAIENRKRRQMLEQLLAEELAKSDEAAKEAIEREYNEKLRKLDDEYAYKLEHEENLLEEIRKLEEAEAKAKKKREAAEAKERRKQKAKELYEDQRTAIEDATEYYKAASGALGNNMLSIFRNAGKARQDAALAGSDDPDRDVKGAQINAAFDIMAGFAKQLEKTAADVAEAQTEIDTRLQGSKNDKSVLGSYWSRMSSHITGNIGMSPFIRQADAVNNLKTLVGKGIAFNVEQRAFLETISDKIATTFEATDASLLKLVRIQQADSTAARLGMESALTAFLNNMYETTEYMTEAADSIRASIYEASALMSAEEATEFEYQVQKWMGSLYSVGFQNTQGLSDALGKLAAGDISGITDDSYGNLLVMAANKANLSIAEILQDGLNDDETNALMHAMVEYLGGIYTETKDNKVVAQQFANVYGLTASDLKAAANLASSTTNVYKNKLNYGGMMGHLSDMANSMGSRTAMGTMVQNVIENFKYTTAAGIGNDPVLYTMYTVASMLDDTVGGIAIPTIGAWAMGNGTEIDLETTVADIMRTGAMAGGLLGGIGKMIGGLTRGANGSGSGMLKAFGVDLNSSSAEAVVKGSGTGLLTTESGMDTSFSGFIGNEDGEVVKNKAITDAKDEANQQAIQALEEVQEIGMANIDEHIVQIYTILNDFALGSRMLHVTYGGSEGNSWTNSNGYSPSGVPML